MSGEELKEGLEGLSKIDSITGVLYDAMYWLAVIFVILFVAYLFSVIVCFVNRRRREITNNDDDFLDD